MYIHEYTSHVRGNREIDNVGVSFIYYILTLIEELFLAAPDGLLQLLALGQLTDHLSQYRYNSKHIDV